LIERVTARTFYCEKEHHPLRIKNNLKAPVEDRRAAAGQLVSSPPRAARRSRQQGGKPPSPNKKNSLLFGICKSQHVTEVKAQHEKHARRKYIKSVKEIHAHLNLQPPHSPIASEGEESSDIETVEERLAHFDDETLMQ
jgi:hypothetical protein